MPEAKRMFAWALATIGAAAAASAVFAQDIGPPARAMMHGGMMGGEIMGGMSRMMEHCGGMMQGGRDRPNDQWRQNAPPKQDRNE